MNPNSQVFHHALKFRKDVCIGCSHCMNVCPTQAIRIRGGKAELTDNYCVDCGKCYRACPVGAIIVEQDDFSEIFNYQHRVALIPSVLMGQFPEKVSFTQVSSVLCELGFNHIYEVENGVEILKDQMVAYVQNNQETKPLISTFCPAIVRLIQVRFPTLTDHFILMKSPLDVSAAYYHQKLIDEGVDPEQIGIFYVTPCAAKIAAVKSPVGQDQSPITGVINMDFIFNKVYTSVKQGFIGKKTCEVPSVDPLKSSGIMWASTFGEAKYMPGKNLAIDEINNVIDFLDELENEESVDVDFLELRACDQSCTGGILTSANRFLAVERMRKRAKYVRSKVKEQNPFYTKPGPINKYRDFLTRQIGIGSIQPRSMEKLDEDMAVAMKKMQKVHSLKNSLPYVDCGICGSPSCSSFAEDIVQDKAEINQCIYIQKKLENAGKLSASETLSLMKKVWGEQKFK